MISKTTSQNLLPSLRTIEYRKFSNEKAVPVINGIAFRIPAYAYYQSNFDEFRRLYFRQVENPTDEGRAFPEGGKILRPESMGYQAFTRYAFTTYGASMIRYILDHHHDLYKIFNIAEGSTTDARGSYADESKTRSSALFLPKKFPSQPYFPSTNQPVDVLAIIHHEFYHTGVWQRLGNTIRDKGDIIDIERQAVIFAENPVRLLNGFEPRYCYHTNAKDNIIDRTINIVTGEVLPGKMTVSKYDIRVLIPQTHKDALK